MKQLRDKSIIELLEDLGGLSNDSVQPMSINNPKSMTQCETLMSVNFLKKSPEHAVSLHLDNLIMTYGVDIVKVLLDTKINNEEIT